MLTKLSSLFIVLTLLAFTHADLIQPVTRTPVRPFAINQGYETDYSFSIYIPSAISVNAYIEVEFPQPYQLPSGCKAYIKIGTGPFTIYSCSKPSYSKYMIYMGSIDPNEYTIVFEGVQNPTSYPASSNFKIKTYLNKIVLIDSNEFFDSVPFLAASGTSKNATIKNIGYTSVSLGSSYDFTFALKTPLAKGDSIKVNFPVGFYFVRPACFHRNSGTYSQIEVLHNNRSVICQVFLDSMATGVFQVVSIIGVVNPEYAGVFKNFYLETLEGTSANVYERISVLNYIQINPGNVTLSIVSASNLLALNTTHQFEFMFENDVPADGEVWIKIPPGFRYLAANCTLLRPIEAQPNGEVTCELAANKTGYIIRGFTGISASQTVTIKAVTENPPVATDYKIQVFSYSTTYNAMIDETFGYITIINQYGASKFFASHSLRWTRRLKHNEPGPLEFTFFLNIPLPSTASTFYGKIIVDIRPKLTLPPAPKSLRCFFYNTIPAQDCIWDETTYSNRTTVSIWTPVTDPYFQTEIPITITTEDSVGTYGILLPMLIQRYKFYFYFWRNGDTKEHEVYFEDYVPDPIELAASDVSLGVYPLQYGQEAYMELVWTNTYITLGTNYYIEFEFDHGLAGWDYNLGFAALPFYDRYELPCLVVNSLVTPAITDYKCYLNPGGSSTTNSTIQVLYIGAIPANTVMTVRLPKIKFGASGNANLRFTLYENTPGENTLRIPIVYKDFYFTPTTATGLATTALSVSLGAYEPDIDTTLTLTFAPSISSGPKYIIYEYPSLFVISTQDVACSSNECFVFTSAQVHWIVFYITNPQGATATTALTIHNPPYIGANTFKARTANSGPIGDLRQGSVTIVAGSLTVTFTREATLNPTETNKNSLIIFEVQTTTVTNIPLDGSIILTFTGLTVPDDDDFACQIVSGLTGQTTALGIICEKLSGYTNKIKIYNINAVTKVTALDIKVQMWTTTTTPVTCAVDTYYDRAATSTKLIDSGSGSLSLTFNNVNFASSVIVNDHSGDFFRAGGYGALTLKITPQHTASSQVTMTITFASGFTLSTTNNDIGYCKLTIGSSTTPVRRRCSVSTSPALTFTIPSLTSTDVTSGVPITLFLTTDYSNPLYKGIKAPSTVGYQVVTVTITDTTSTPTPAFTEVNSQHIYVYPQSIPKFQVTGTCASADYYTMFNFVFTLAQALNSNTDPTTRGRIYLEFPVGTGGFRTDLGTGQPTGGVVGCRVLVGGSLNTNIKCRLVQSPGNNLPAAVELVGFGAITASSVFTVTVARVKHVQTTLGELVFGLRTEHVLVLTGVITPIEYATYNLWHRVTANTPTTASPTTGATDVSFGASPYPNTLQVTMRPKIYSDVQLDSPSPTTDPGTDYYIYELPSDFVVTSTVNCPSSIGSSRCYTFPEIGWVVYEIAGGNSVTADSNTDGSFDYVTMPGAYYYAGYTFYAYVWKSNLYNHKMPHYIQASYITLSTVGTFPSASASITVATDQLTQNRANTEITVSFTTQSAIPSTGTIEIRFAAGVTPQPQCKNSPSMGSALTSSTGRVACSIQSNSWLITNFDNVAAGANIRIYGFVTLASTSGSYAVDLYSYSNQDTTSIATLGNTIDSLKSYLSISVNTYNTLSLDSMPSFLINSPAIAKASNYRPLIFYFTLNGMSLTASSGTIQITVLAASTNFLTSTAPNANLICSFMNPSSGAYTACSITSSGTTSGGNSYTTYTLTPLEDLSANTQYRGTITTVFAQNGLDGIQHPSVAATYQVSIIATQGGSQQADIDFFEIVPDKFSSLTVKNYVIAPSEEDVIDISLTTSSSIGTGDRIVVELPTLFNTTTLFANDLGLGLIDYQDKLCEVISPSGLTMSCFFQKGNSYAGTPASIVLYGFSAAVTSLRFAFTAKNPAVTSPTVLPLTIYSVSGTTPPFTKTYYETVERAIIVLPSSIMGTLSNNNQPSYTPTTVKSTTATLSITLTFSSTLGPNDYYALKVPQMGSSAPVASGTAASSIINGVAADYIVLPKNRFIILRPNSAVSSGVLVTVPNLYNPEQGLGSANLGFTGYASHFSTMAVEKITYSMNSADFTGLTSLSATAIIAASTSETSQKNTLTITINAIYQGIQSVIITVPSEFTLREDCYEGYNNAVVTYQCTTDSTNSRVYVTLESGTTYSSSAANLILTVLVTNSATSGTVSPFGFYLYTTTQTDPTVLQGQRYAVTSVSSGIALATTVTNAASPTFLEAEYVPYVENNLFYPTSTYGQIKFTATLQGAVTASSTTFKIYLPSILAFDTATAGDLSLTPAVILYSSSISGGYVLLTASYASGTLSCTSTVSLSSSTTVTFTITTIQQTGETVGIRVPTSAYAKTFFNVILEQTTGATTYTSQIGDLTVSSAPTYTATLAPMTKAASTVTAWEFTINFGGSSTIDNFYIDLPTIDDFGNSLFDTGLGVFTQDGSLVPCSSTSVSSGLVTPECTFYMGTSSRPARILVRGFSTGTNIVLYIAGIMNPAVNRRVYMNIRFYIGTTFNSMTNIVGYLTESASGVNSASGTVTGPVAYRPGTWSFNSGVTLSSTIVLVKLPSACTIGWLSGSQHFLTGSIGNYVLQKTSISPYTFNNFGCTAAATLGSFTQYHMTASTSGVSNGEIRTSSYGVSASTLQGSTTYALVSTIAIQSAIVSSNLYGQSAMAKLSFDISSLASKFTINSADYLGPGFIITIAFSNYYFASISKCQIFGGLTRISPNNPIQCSISGTTIAITNFGGVMSSGNYLQIQLSYTNSGNPYPSGTPTAVFNVYGSSTLESGSDFSAYASVTSSILSVDASYASGVSLWSFGTPSFPSPPAPGQTGITSINIAPSQFPSWTTSSDYIRIGFEKSLISNSAYCNVGSYTGYYTGCSIVSGSGSFDYVFISLTDGMSYGSGFPYSTTIDIYINWPVDSKNFFYDVAIVYGSSTSSYSYRYRSYSVTASIEKIDSMSVSTSQLHRVSNYLNEIHYQTTIPMAIDPSTTLLSFTYPSSYINVQSQNLTQIDCYCTEPAKCYNYNAGTSGAIDVYFDSSTPIPVGTTIDCYIPNVLQTGSFYPVYRIIDASSRQGYFTTTAITSLSVPDSAPGTHTLTVNYPSSPIYPYTSYSPTIQISSSIPYNSGDMAYLDFGTGGPLYTCGGYTVPTQCRYYSNVRTILVLPITAYQVASTAFDILNVGSLQFNYRHSDLNTNYTITSYVVDGTSMQSYTTTSTVTASTFSPETTNIVHTVVDGVLRQGLFGLQKLSFSTGTNSIPAINSLGVGGRIIITVSGIGNVPTPTSCYAGYTKIPITCSMTGSGTSYTIQLTHTSSVPASKNIEIFFRGTNPTSGNPTITLKGYSYYNPGNTNYAVKVLAHGTVTPPSYTAYTGTYVGVSNQGSLSFITKTINPAKAPIRVKFQLTSILPATSGKIELQLPSGEYAYGGNLYGFFRTYSTDFDYTQKEAYAISVSGTTLTVQPIADLPANTVHEVIITTDQASTPHFTVISTNGKTMPVTFENSGGIIFKQTINLYKYNPTPAVILQTFYYTSKYASDLNVLVLNMKANAAITVFSTSILEIELSSASGNLIQNGMTSSTRQLTCGVTGAALSTVAVRSASSAAAPKCIIVQSTTGSPKIRIENYAAMTSTSTFNIILYDLKNSIIPKDSVSYFDFVVVYTDMSTNARYKHKLTRAFTTTTGSSGASSALSSPTLSPYYYGAPTALSVSVTWPSGQSCSTNCRMVIRSSGTDWKFKDAANFRFQIDNNPQSVLLDLANNYFVLLGVTGISGGLVGGMPYTFSFTSVSPANTFVNPLPYQANSNSFTMQFSVNNQYAGVRTLALTSLYSALTSTPLTVSGVCTPFNGLLTGVSGSPGGNVECYIDVPLSSAYISMTAFQIDFPTTSQYSKIHNYCAAYVIQVSGTTTTTPGGQLTCSRVDASASSHSILVSGFSYPISSSSTIRVTFRARALSTTLSVDVNQYVASSSTSVYATSSSYPLSLSAAASSSYTSITSFQVQSFVPAPLAIASPGTKSPLRIVTYIGGTISAANSGYIQVTLGSGFPLNGLTVPQCSLRYESSYALPIITQCTYDSTNRIFKLTPVVDISTTGRYLITIGSLQSDLTSDGVTFPIDTTRVSAKVLIYSGTSTISADLIYIANIANSLYGFSISPQYNQVGSTSSQFELNFQPSSSVGADTTTDEVIFVLEFPTSLYDYDLGASTVTYAADGITYYNGVFLPSSGATSINLGTSTIATLHYGPSTQNPQVIISGHNGLLSSSSYTLSLGLIKNPAANKPQKVNFYVLSYSSGKAYATVLYQASYTNYYYTVPTAGETGSTPLWSFSSPYAQQTTNIILSTKTYGTIDANSKIYVKLLNQAKGFDYSAITGITCTGSVTYTVQWHKAGYIFYILPNGVVSSPPTITCSGFTLGTTIEDIWIETGIHRAGNYIYASKQLITMSVLNPMPGSGNSIATYDGTNTRNSVKRYTITVNTNTFILKAGGYLKFVMPSGLAVVPGLSEYIFVTGLTDKSTGSSPTSIQATIVSGNLIVTGYKDFSGSFKITMFLKNVLGGSNQIILWMYDQQGKNVAQANLNSIAVSTSTTDYTQGGSVVSMLTDTLDVWASERFRMTFKLGVANTYSYSSSSSFVITLPTGFSLLSGYEICKYKLTTSTLWIRSTCSISTQTISIPLVSGFNIAGGSVVDVRLTTENADYTQTGMDRPSTTNIRHIFNIRTQNPSSGSIEQVYIPFILYPKPTDLTFALTWYTRGSSDDAVVNVQFIPLVDLTATDFFELHLVSHDEITTVFPIDLGTGVTDNRVIGNCAEHPDYNTISNSANDLLGCYFQQGRTASYYPTKLVVRNEKAITASSTPTVRYLAAKLRNPGGIPGGFVINVMKPCRFDNYGCPIYRLRDYKSFGVSSPKTLTTTTRATPGSPLTYLLQDDSLTTFTFSLSNTVTPTDAIVVITNTVNIIIQDRCTSTGSNKCIHFPAIGWTWYQPGSNLNSGTSVSIQFTIDNAVYYDRTNPNDLFIEPNVNGGIQQIIQSPHPNYNVWVPTLATFPTQTDWNNPYIVRNFDNIIRISILGIWRTSLVRRIVVNTPSSYIDITSTYCQAGIELQDVGSTTWYEFPCQVTGPKQITLWINDPTRWTSTYALQNVRVYFRGFLPVNYATGLTTSSTITSYCDLTQPYVLDENTNYAFTISPTPTPIIRDVNLNLKSVNDRIAQISDYVMFYAAIWPNTPYGTGNPITQLLFEIDDEYAYPSLANLICMTKVVFKIQVSCTLKRQQGRTLIYVTPPPSYQNSPFLLTITNTAENLLFIAPDHEGSFRFNVTYLDASGNAVEKAESFMDIVGEYVQVFSAEPIRRDPDLKTLYDIQFTTATRVTPQGFAQSGQPVSTEIVLLFQTYSPAYPLDLGSGLADGSEMSCIAVTGLTFNIQKKLTCKLVYGLPTDHSLVKITGYDAIPAGTSVRIFIDDIITMPVAVTSRIQLEIRSTYAATGETFVFYNSLVVSPQKPTASTASSNPTWNVVRATGASAVLRERTTYTVSFTLTTQVNSGDYLIFDFPSYGYELESDYSNVVVVFQSSSYPCSSWVMPKTNRIYIQPQATLPTSGSLSFNIVNIQNPSFYLSGSYTFKLRAIVSQKLIDDYSSSFALTSTVCTLFSSEQIIYNSSYVRMNENTYQISFSVDHEVPAAGSLAIVFDPTKYNLRPSSPTCELVSGFNSLATCGFELFIQPLVRIKMNGQAMSAGTVVKVNIINVNNPTDNSALATITLQSYFDSAFGTTDTICSKSITLPAFQTLAAIKCPITLKPEVKNANTVTDYILTLSCSGDIRNATVVDVQFPAEFSNSFSSALSCSTNGNYMLDQCALIARTTRVTILVSKPSAQQALEIRIRNIKNPPGVMTYTTSVVNLLQYGVDYGAIDSTTSDIDITITSNDNLVKSDSKLALSIFPKNYGEKATYFFLLPGINVKQVPTDLILDFDTSFPTSLGSSIECGTFTPDSTFGKSYALNYETLNNYKGFSCEVSDDNKLTFTLSPTFTIQANKPYDLFFYVQGIINPSVNAQTSYSFNFLLTASGAAVFSSQNPISIAFALPPSLLQLKDFTTSDSNILAPATYTFTLQATTALPASTTTSIKEYELEVSLPSTLYPDFQQSVQVVYSFPDNPSIQSGSSAFNYENDLFFSASYPNLQTLGAFRLVLSNITNPSVESFCGLNAAGDPITFETQYVSRQKGFVYGRTYPISDQQNCLPLGKSRDAIKVISPLYLRKGLIYNITLQVEEAASDLYLTPISTFLTFEPKTVSFLNYQSRTVTLSVVVPTNVPKAEYLIQWKKRETGTHVNYLEVPDTRVIVVDETISTSTTPIPKVKVETITYVWTGTSPRDVLATLDIAPAEQLIVQIKSKTVDTKLKGSTDGITFTLFPISLTFNKGEASKKFYISASDGAKNNVLTYTISGTDVKSYDSRIADTPFSVQTQLSSTGFQVLSIQQVAVLENKVSYLASVSNIGTMFYMAVIESSFTPTKDQIISGQLSSINSQFYIAGSVDIQKIQYASSYSAYINITGLLSQTQYSIYFVARSTFGQYSDIKTYTFKTLKVSEGAILSIPSLTNITVSTLIDALSVILPVDKSRLIFSGANEYPAPVLGVSNQALGSQLNGYQITIAPDPNNNSPTPLEIANELQTQAKQDQLAALVPGFYSKAGVRVTSVRRISPRVIVTPSISQVGYYDMTVHAELIEVGKLFAIVTEKTTDGNVMPTSYQISQGLMANNQKLDDRYFKVASTTVNGDGNIVFDELRDYTQYNVYVTAGNDVPYDPVDILANSEVMRLEVQTLKNPNIGSSDQALSLYDSYYASANRILGLFWGTLLMLFAAILYI